MPLRVIVVSAQALTREALLRVIESSGDITVVAAVGDHSAAADLVRAHRPDVVIVDSRGCGGDAIAALRGRPGGSAARVLLLDHDANDRDTARALRSGASGLLSADVSAAGLLSAVRAVANGETPLSAVATRMLVTHFRSAPSPGLQGVPSAMLALTPREQEVTALAAQGRNNDEIAEHLSVSLFTVRTHIRHSLRKLGARNRAQLVALAFKTGLVSTRSAGGGGQPYVSSPAARGSA
ncbi:response regulator transcription factor [Streptomyces sp. NPDC002928]|uniref:response regulator transcription factor n=1 Tax=Streptomyces sp. NPDC002928 TaxID=3154440 RepID=UPI00339F226F